MFKEEKIELYCKLFCFIIFLLVIIFLDNIYSLLVLFGYFFLTSRKEDNCIIVIFYAFTILGMALGFINNNLSLFKLFLCIDFAYYFIRYVKENKHSVMISKVSKKNSNDKIKYYDNEDSDEVYDHSEIVINSDKINEINNELKKGNLLKEEDINFIKSHLNEKEKDNLKEQETVKFIRFVNFKNTLKFYKWQFNLDDINGMYVICHLLILILAIVVE